MRSRSKANKIGYIPSVALLFCEHFKISFDLRESLFTKSMIQLKAKPLIILLFAKKNSMQELVGLADALCY